jgi:trk system potassium uptake protein TrkH
MGVLVLSVGLLSVINPSGGLSLFKAEATGISVDKITPKIKDTAKTLWIVYITLTLIDTLLLKLFGMNWFDAINHAFSTISTGGFSTKNASLGYWDKNLAIIWITTIFMLLSGINFIAHIKLFNDDFSGYKTSEVKWYFAIFFTLAIALSYYYYLNVGNNLTIASTHSFFTIASILTTTGFATTNYALWGHGAIVVVFIAMFIGGNAGSTAGGVKVIRYVIIFKSIASELKRVIKPNNLVSVFVDNNKIENKILLLVFVFFFLYLLTTVALSLYLFFNGHNSLTSISAALAIVGNIGPGFGNVDPASNFAFFSSSEKIVLSIGMIIGRLECFTVFVLFSKSFWKKF